MPTISEVRAKYPQYSDISDRELADALHQKYYADMPKADVYSSLGLKEQQSIMDVFKQRAESERQLPKDILGGLVRGAGSIGATILSPIDAAARALGVENSVIGRTDRRESMDDALKSLGANPDSLAFGVGKVGSEIAGTAGVGGVLAKPLQVVAPSLAKAVSQAGLAKDVGRWTNIGGGALTGAGSSVWVNPDASEVATGAVLGGTLPATAQSLAKAIGAIRGIPNSATLRAKKVLEESLGENLPQARQAFTSAPNDVTAAQAVAAQSDAQNPVFQALAERSGERLNSVQQTAETMAQQDAARRTALEGIAGGETQTVARGVREEAVNALNAATEPVKNVELSAANIAGEALPRLQGEADRLAQAAADKVEDVRRFTAAGGRAGDRAASTYTVPGMPRVPGRYTYMGELENRAEQVAQQAADASLPFGQAARFKQAAADSLAEHGLRPLTADKVISKISGISKNPKFAGNDLIESSINQLKDDLQKWSNADGVIDAFALDAIRKNSVNATVQKMRPNMDVTQQNRLAAQVLNEIKPKLIDAIEEAGGTGYREYLEGYAKSRQAIAQQKLGAEALDLYSKNPEEFIRLVEGDSPQRVEKIFGAGNYDIVKEMSQDALESLGKVSSELKRDTEMAVQAAKGRNALEQLIESNLPRFRMPMWFNWKATVGNKALAILEDRIGQKTMDKLAKALESGKSADELLSTVPAIERMRIMNILAKPEKWGEIPTDVKRVISTSLTAGFAKNRKQQ